MMPNQAPTDREQELYDALAICVDARDPEELENMKIVARATMNADDPDLKAILHACDVLIKYKDMAQTTKVML